MIFIVCSLSAVGFGKYSLLSALLGEQVIRTRGLLRNKTRLLVSHGVKCSW